MQAYISLQHPREVNFVKKKNYFLQHLESYFRKKKKLAFSTKRHEPVAPKEWEQKVIRNTIGKMRKNLKCNRII